MAAEVLWPDRYSLYDLMLHRASIGHAAFEAEHQNDPIDPASCEWPPELFDWPGLWFDVWPDGLEVRTVAVDPSKGRDAKHGDYSAIVSFGRSAAGVEFAEADLARRPVDRICEDAARACAKLRADVLALEANGFQELLASPLREALAREGVEVAIMKLENTTSKHVRVRRLTLPLTTKRMRFKARSPGTHLLVEQLRQFPQGAHDDGPDALEMARRAAIEWTKGGRRPAGR